MFIFRESFVTKPGQASKLAKLMKQTMHSLPNVRVITDQVGQYNRVEVEYQYESLTEYENAMKDWKPSPEEQELMKDYFNMYQEGRRDIFKVW